MSDCCACRWAATTAAHDGTDVARRMRDAMPDVERRLVAFAFVAGASHAALGQVVLCPACLDDFRTVVRTMAAELNAQARAEGSTGDEN